MTVASRIGLMNHGKLAQVATPAEIYENPASRFVADFIGDVNLLAGKAGKTRRDGSEVLVEFHGSGQQKLFLARSAVPLEPGSDCHLAVRPEKILISRKRPRNPENLLEGRVHDIAYVGNLSTYHVRIAGGSIVKAQEANRRRIENREITWEDPVFLAWTAGSGILLTT
jgi:putrescine transport system ATP-binding protein